MDHPTYFPVKYCPVEHITSHWAHQWFPINIKTIILSPMGTFKKHLIPCCSLLLQYAHHQFPMEHPKYFPVEHITSHWAHQWFPIDTKTIIPKSHGNIQGAFNFMLFTSTTICTLLIFHGTLKILSCWAHNFPLSMPMISYWYKNHYTRSYGNIQGAFDCMLFTPTLICTPLIYHGPPNILSC